MSLDELWQTLVKLHIHTKSLVLLAEEIGEDLQTNLHIIQQWGYAHEHSMRATGIQKGLKVGVDESEKESAIRDNLESAIKHEYRAFWDAADWVSILYRDKIYKLLVPYSTQCIKDIIPEWYSEMQPNIQEINEKIAGFREQKDGAKSINAKLDEAKEYRNKIDYLKECYKKVLKASSTMCGYKYKEWKKLLLMLGLGIIGTLMAVFLYDFFN